MRAVAAAAVGMMRRHGAAGKLKEASQLAPSSDAVSILSRSCSHPRVSMLSRSAAAYRENNQARDVEEEVKVSHFLYPPLPASVL